MIVGERFTGDSMRIAWIQHDVYGSSLSTIFDKAKEHYKRAKLVLDIETDLGKRLDNTNKFDHRTLQWFHDAIAGKFRFIYCTQGDLFASETENSSQESDIILTWQRFLIKELERLFLQHVELPRQICTAAIFANPNPRGIAAEDYLYEFTLIEYRDLSPGV
ncbi:MULTISPECIES: hypothetical protein [unclassified Acinetobacter]|jgi:hypothetical protein|uniref:hypothetical protein n=1 Tax=unclassified Acinetobacter TaxID=196816 RepID=UPI0015D1075B|nr:MULTISPECIES: hypothetical protein [unclassified Acinetobacter]